LINFPSLEEQHCLKENLKRSTLNIQEKYSSNTLFFVFLSLLVLSSGCAQKTTVVLLPDPSGKVGHVTVTTNAGSVDITQAREATVVKGRESLPAAPKILSENAIQADFTPVIQS